MKKWFVKHDKTDFYALYTVAFSLISLFIFMCFYLNGKSLIWSHDGVPQHVNLFGILRKVSEGDSVYSA